MSVKVFSPQLAQAVTDSAAENWPGLHSWGAVIFANWQYEPAGQFQQIDWFAIGLYFPFSHSEQAVAEPGETVPAGHRNTDVFGYGQYDPAGQVKQTD
jgi:hypothetical protein